jgi:hypothetical protein
MEDNFTKGSPLKLIKRSLEQDSEDENQKLQAKKGKNKKNPKKEMKR